MSEGQDDLGIPVDAGPGAQQIGLGVVLLEGESPGPPVVPPGGTLTMPRVIPDIMYSVFEWLKSRQYTVGVVTGPLTTHFQDLKIVPAYPDDLTVLATPVIAPGGPMEILGDDEFFGESDEESVYSIALAGIVMGRGSEALNRTYRDRLMNDLYHLMRRAESEGIPLYEAAAHTLLGEETLEIIRVRARQVPVNALEIEADRFKFTVEADVCVVVST